VRSGAGVLPPVVASSLVAASCRPSRSDRSATEFVPASMKLSAAIAGGDVAGNAVAVKANAIGD
jgi:hypothetical protein